MICSFDFYVSKFHGDKYKFDAEAFFKNAIKAEFILKKYGINTDEVDDNIKMCCCALAELNGEHEQAAAAEIKNINSESVQGYSVSYNTQTSSSKIFNKAVRDTIALYLGANALYRGRGRYVL